MSVQRGLLRILWRQAMPATCIGMLGLIAYVLFWPDVMTASDRWPSLLVGVQCLLLVGSLGRFTSPAFSFLYSRGYSRDTLWNHTMLASLLSVLVAWLPATLIVWSGLRSAVHDHLFQSPNFPIMAPCEIWVPLVWLGIFVLLTPAFHYAWIRRAQPTKGGFGGFVLSFGIVVALLMSFNIAFYFYFWWLAWLAGVLFVLAVVFLVLGGRALHRSMEVRA